MRAAVAGAGCSENGSVFRACARGRARSAGKVLGTPRGDAPGAALARSGPAIFLAPVYNTESGNIL